MNLMRKTFLNREIMAPNTQNNFYLLHHPVVSWGITRYSTSKKCWSQGNKQTCLDSSLFPCVLSTFHHSHQLYLILGIPVILIRSNEDQVVETTVCLSSGIYHPNLVLQLAYCLFIFILLLTVFLNWILNDTISRS